MAGDSLKGRRILVTRPRAQARVLAHEIAARGGIAKLCPMLEIVPLPPPPPGWWEGYDWIVFVSANAVRTALAAGLPPRVSARLAAIGPATATALKNAALPVACQAPPPYTSESLLLQPPLQQVTGQKILIVRGVGGRPLLAEQLTRRGARVSLLELYRRLPPAAETVERLRSSLAEGLDGVLVSSGEALNNLCRATGDQLDSLCSLPLIVSSERLASMARETGFADVTTASSAVDADMLSALEKRLG